MHKRRLTRREKRSKNKKVVIISTICLMFAIVTGYAAFQTNLSITAKGNIKEKSRVIQAWDANSQTDFHSDFYKQNIVSAEFLDNADVPSNATESWNVSEDQKHGGVMAWVVPNNDDNTKYDLYIGAKDGVIANVDSSYLFYNFSGLTNISFNRNFNTSNTINMSYMFSHCSALTDLDVSNFDTSNTTNMFHMFSYLTNLKEIVGLTNFNTSNVTNMSCMFSRSQSLQLLDLSSFDTSKVTNMSWMFDFCYGLTELDLKNFDTSNVITMQAMFNECHNLEKINVSSFNTSNVTTMYQMFEATGLTSLNLCSFDTSNVTNMAYMFAYSWSKVSPKIYVGEKWITSQADTANMFLNSDVSSVTTGQC